MALFEALVERRIVTAMAEGAFDHLPGRGRPLALDDDCLTTIAWWAESPHPGLNPRRLG